MQDGNGNYQKAFPLFGMGMGIIKKLSRYLGRETQKSLSAIFPNENSGVLLSAYAERFGVSRKRYFSLKKSPVQPCFIVQWKVLISILPVENTV